MSKPSIGMIRTLEDCIRALNNLRNYFNEPDIGISATVVIPKLTTDGANGSMTFVSGALTGYTPAT